MDLALDLPRGIEERRAVSEQAARQGAEDALLVEDVREGRPGAFDRLYARYARMVHGILLARVPRREAEDLVQDVFLTVHRRLHTLREARAFGGWLAIIARNRAMDHARHRQEPVELTEDIVAGGESPGTETEAAEVLDAIRTLPEAYREPLILRLVEGMTGPEISERTGLTSGSVRVNLHRGMALLRQSLRRSQTHG